jgi:hypothetical protein
VHGDQKRRRRQDALGRRLELSPSGKHFIGSSAQLELGR